MIGTPLVRISTSPRKLCSMQLCSIESLILIVIGTPTSHNIYLTVLHRLSVETQGIGSIMEHSVLDDALDDFAPTTAVSPVQDRDPGKFSASNPAGEAGSTSVGDASTASAPAQAFDPLGKRKKEKAAGGPAFDPLKQSRATRQAGSKGKAAPTAGSSGQHSKSSGKQPAAPEQGPAQPQKSPRHGEIDADLARGVAQLMADLAKAARSAGEDAGKSLPHEREIASTLAALAAAVPSRGTDGASSQSSAAQRWDYHGEAVLP